MGIKAVQINKSRKGSIHIRRCCEIALQIYKSGRRFSVGATPLCSRCGTSVHIRASPSRHQLRIPPTLQSSEEVKQIERQNWIVTSLEGSLLSLSTLPLPLTGLLETTQSTEAASVVSPIPGPHQTSGTATQLDEPLEPLLLPLIPGTAQLTGLLFLLRAFFLFTFLESQSAEVLITAGTDTCGGAAQPSPRNVAKFFFLGVRVVGGSWVGLVGENGARRIAEMVDLERVDFTASGFGSVSALGRFCFGFLGLLYLLLRSAPAVEVSETAMAMFIDATEVLSWITNHTQLRGPARVIVEDIRGWQTRFRKLVFRSIFREQNVAAD
nr:hypothetical protein DM860_007011 [Ipomoea batatas]